MKIDLKKIIKYILLLYLLQIKIILSQKNSWTYIKCKNYLNNLDIICTKITDNQIFSICEDWKTKEPLSINNIPKNCLNKIYILSLIINEENTSSKVNCIVNIKEQKIMGKEFKNNNKHLYHIDEDIMKCLNFFENFEEIFTSIMNDYDGKKMKYNDLKKKLNVSSFCIDLSLNLINQLENHVENKPLKNNTKSPKKEYDYNNYLNNKIYNCIKQNEVNDEDKYISGNDNMKYFEVNERGENNQGINNNDNELQSSQYSSKDCVEYGLKNEEYIICTKYE